MRSAIIPNASRAFDDAQEQAESSRRAKDSLAIYSTAARFIAESMKIALDGLYYTPCDPLSTQLHRC